jgi:pseudaminic acid biosynthesis-associated methylase
LNQQEIFWSGQFGNEYTDRNTLINQSTLEKFGVSRAAMNKQFLDTLDIKTVLEVGCNRGEQLSVLEYHYPLLNLYGIDINEHALSEARQKDFNIIKGSALNIPFKSNYFDLVFTSGVLIHIAPDNLFKIMSEIYRCSKRYIWGMEYFSPNCQEIKYRNNDGFLWKNDFSKLYLDYFPNLELIHEHFYDYQDGSDNTDAMFLLEKKS